MRGDASDVDGLVRNPLEANEGAPFLPGALSLVLVSVLRQVREDGHG